MTKPLACLGKKLTVSGQSGNHTAMLWGAQLVLCCCAVLPNSGTPVQVLLCSLAELRNPSSADAIVTCIKGVCALICHCQSSENAAN